MEKNRDLYLDAKILSDAFRERLKNGTAELGDSIFMVCRNGEDCVSFMAGKTNALLETLASAIPKFDADERAVLYAFFMAMLEEEKEDHLVNGIVRSMNDILPKKTIETLEKHT